MKKRLPAGAIATLAVGESITVTNYLYHGFCWEVGTRTVIVGEVSKVNDDNADNQFPIVPGRFSTIEADAAPLHHLYNECRT